MELSDAEARLVLWMSEQSHDGVTGSIADRLARLRGRIYDYLAPEPEPEPQSAAEPEPLEDPPPEEPQAEEIPEEVPEETPSDPDPVPANGTDALPWVVAPAVLAAPVAGEA